MASRPALTSALCPTVGSCPFSLIDRANHSAIQRGYACGVTDFISKPLNRLSSNSAFVACWKRPQPAQNCNGVNSA